MSDETERAKPTVNYPADVPKAMQLLLQRKIVDADAVVTAFAEVREEAVAAEIARVVAWLKKRPCPTPATWPALVASLEAGEHRGE